MSEKHIISIDYEEELLGGNYIAGIDGRKYPDAPIPGIGKAKDEAIGCCIMNNPGYFGIDIVDESGIPDWPEDNNQLPGA